MGIEKSKPHLAAHKEKSTMKMLSHPHHHTSHPTHQPWDRLPHTENDDLLNEEIKKLIEGFPTSINTELYSNKHQYAYPATKEDINTYTPGYQQFAHKAEKNISNKKRECSVNKDLSESKAIGISETDHSDLHKDIQSLQKLHANIIAGKREYIAKGEEKFEHFEYPDNNSFKSVKTEEKR